MFQLSAAAHNNHAAYYGITETTQVIPTTSGAGLCRLRLQIKNIPTGPGDTINIQAVYTDGAILVTTSRAWLGRTSSCSAAPTSRAPTRALALPA